MSAHTPQISEKSEFRFSALDSEIKTEGKSIYLPPGETFTDLDVGTYLETPEARQKGCKRRFPHCPKKQPL
jgi:hypothetical protein